MVCQTCQMPTPELSDESRMVWGQAQRKVERYLGLVILGKTDRGADHSLLLFGGSVCEGEEYVQCRGIAAAAELLAANHSISLANVDEDVQTI